MVSRSLYRVLVPRSALAGLIVMNVRAAAEPEIEHLARLWHDGWHDAYGQIVPAELVGLRTVESFAERLQAALAETRVAGPLGDAVGLCIIKDDELYQLYVAAQARGTVWLPH
jgi:hypothetical protein